MEHCLPNSLLRRWLEEMRALRPGTAYHSLDPAGLGRDDAITDVLDTTGVLDRREATMAEHRSQASPFDGLSPDSGARFWPPTISRESMRPSPDVAAGRSGGPADVSVPRPVAS